MSAIPRLPVDGGHMHEPTILSPQKRQCPEQCQYLLTGAPQPQPKRQKTSHRTIKTQPPAEFWDNLSKIWLSGNALRELDRRTAQSVPSPPHPSQRIHRPLTRSVLAKYKGAQQPTQSAPAILSRYIPERLRDIKLFARHGGPDLSDLKGVCVVRHLQLPVLISLSLVSGTCPPSPIHNGLEPVYIPEKKSGFDIYCKNQIHKDCDHQEHRPL